MIHLPRLEEGCWICENLHQPKDLVLYESKTSLAKLNPDQLFRGYTFLVLKWHEEELHNLSAKNRKSFLEDMSLVGTSLAAALKPDKMNYELLGNAQPHLHWHIVPRYKTDPMWGRPIWAGSRRRNRLTQEGYLELVKKIREHLPHTTPPASRRPS